MSHPTKIYSYCSYTPARRRKEKFSLKRDLRINGVFYLKCLFAAAMCWFVAFGFIGV